MHWNGWHCHHGSHHSQLLSKKEISIQEKQKAKKTTNVLGMHWNGWHYHRCWG